MAGKQREMGNKGNEMTVKRAEKAVAQTLDRVRNTASRTEKIALLAFGTLIVVLFNVIEPRHDLLWKARSEYLKAKAEFEKAVAKLGAAEESQNQKIADAALSIEKSTNHAAAHLPTVPTEKLATRNGTDITSEIPVLEAETRIRSIEMERAYREVASTSTDIEFFGLKLRVPMQRVAPLWNMALLFLIGYLYAQRLVVWALCAEACRKLRVLGEGRVVFLEEMHADVPWWAAPIPSRSPRDIDSKNDHAVKAEELAELAGWSASLRLSAFVVFAAAVVLVFLQLRVANAASRLPDIKEFLKGAKLQGSLSLSSLLILMLTVFAVWLWFRPTVVPLRGKAWSDAINLRPWAYWCLVFSLIICAILPFTPTVLVELPTEVTKQMPWLLTFGLGSIGAIAVAEVFLRRSKEAALDKSGMRRRYFVRISAGIVGGVALSGLRWLTFRTPRFITAERKRRRKLDFPALESPGLAQGFYANRHLPRWFQRKQGKAAPRSPNEIAKSRAAVPIGPLPFPEEGTAYYVDAKKYVLFARTVATHNLRRIEAEQIRFDNVSLDSHAPLPHVKLPRASATFEKAAIDCIKEGKHGEACELVISGIRHDLFYKKKIGRARSTRLFDLLALVIYRYDQNKYIKTFSDLVQMGDEVAGTVTSRRVRIHKYKHIRARNPAFPVPNAPRLTRKSKPRPPHDLDAWTRERKKDWEKRKMNWQSSEWQKRIADAKTIRNGVKTSVNWAGLPM